VPLAIWYAKHPQSRKRGATKFNAGAANDSDVDLGANITGSMCIIVLLRIVMMLMQTAVLTLMAASVFLVGYECMV
jgi:hypothetical protein